MTTAVTPLALGPAYFIARKDPDDRIGIVLRENFAPFFERFVSESPLFALISIIHSPPLEREAPLKKWLASHDWERLLTTFCKLPLSPKHRECHLGPLLAYFISEGKDVKKWLEEDEERLVLAHRATFGPSFLGVELPFQAAVDPKRYLEGCRKPKEYYFAQMIGEEIEKADMSLSVEENYAQALSLLPLVRRYRSEQDLRYFEMVKKIQDEFLKAFVQRKFPYQDRPNVQEAREAVILRQGFTSG